MNATESMKEVKQITSLTYAIVAAAGWDQEHEDPPLINQQDQYHPVL